MLFEQSELDINFLSLAVALSNFTYKAGNVCLIERANNRMALKVIAGKDCVRTIQA